MPISYDKLWKALTHKRMARTDKKGVAGVIFNGIAKMGENKFVSIESLYKICIALTYGINDVMELTNYGHD